MFARTLVLSLASSFLIGRAAGLELDVTSQDSIKSAAKTLASSIIAAYNDSLKQNLIPGLFPSPYYFWESGAVLDGLIECSYLTGDSQYNELLSQGVQWQLGDSDAFMPPNQTKTLGNDDQSFWGLAAMTAAEVGLTKPKSGDWVDFASNVFNTQVARLEVEEGTNGTCGGGLRWQLFTFNNGYEYKNTMSNGNFFLLGARLAKFTGNETYSGWAEKSYTWAKDIGLIGDDYAVYDGTSATTDCKQINRIRWTAVHGTYTEGAAIMYNLTNGGQNWTTAVQGLVDASAVFLDGDVLVEVACEGNGKCDTDQRAFKGIAARSYARAAISAPFVADSINKMLETSAKGAASTCDGSGTDVQCKLSWSDASSQWEAGSAKDGNLGEVFNVLEVVQGLLYKSSKPLATGNETTTGSVSGNATQSGGAASPKHTGSAGTIAASFTAVLAVAFAAALSF